jgi:hypothetical protein
LAPRHSGARVSALDAIYNSECHTSGKSPGAQRAIIDVIYAAADECVVAAPGLNLENKVVLSIATRLRAERFIVSKINDNAFWEKIANKQTQLLIRKFKKLFPVESDIATLLDRVAIMTPENIHLNSFMYEPILDMSDDHLKRLYSDVAQLA